MTPSILPAPILSRRVAAVGLPASGQTIALETSPGERERLAALNGLEAVNACTASFLLRPVRRTGVRVTGELRARVVQVSVVSMEPFETELAQPIDVLFLTPDALETYRVAAAKRQADPAEAEEQEDEPDPILDGSIDLGVLAAEYLSLGLDPYPRRPGEAFVEPAPREDDPDVSPFAALKALKPDAD